MVSGGSGCPAVHPEWGGRGKTAAYVATRENDELCPPKHAKWVRTGRTSVDLTVEPSATLIG
jgi:hypothetical protein